MSVRTLGDCWWCKNRPLGKCLSTNLDLHRTNMWETGVIVFILSVLAQGMNDLHRLVHCFWKQLHTTCKHSIFNNGVQKSRSHSVLKWRFSGWQSKNTKRCVVTYGRSMENQKQVRKKTSTKTNLKFGIGYCEKLDMCHLHHTYIQPFALFTSNSKMAIVTRGCSVMGGVVKTRLLPSRKGLQRFAIGAKLVDSW